MIYTDANGYFGFDVPAKYITGDRSTLEINVTKDSSTSKAYSVTLPTEGIVVIVYDTGSQDKSENDKVSVSESYRIFYMNIDGAEHGAARPITYTRGIGAKLSAPSKPCHAFGGWYESADFDGEPVTEISADKSGDVTLYAKWTEAHVYGEPQWTWTQTDGGYTASAKFTCTADGHYVIKTAAVTGKTAPAACTEKGSATFTASVTFNEKIYTDTKTTEIAALGHAFGEWAETTAPTCTEKGVETRVCAHDGKHTETREIAALGHSFGEWTETAAPTAETDGEETRACSVCGETETRPVPYIPNTDETENGSQSLLWLMIVLAVILAAECVVLALRIRAKKKRRANGVKTYAVLPLMAATYPAGEIAAVAVLAAAVVAFGIAIAFTFKKDKTPAHGGSAEQTPPEPASEFCECATAADEKPERTNAPRHVNEEVKKEIERIEQLKTDNVTAEEASALVSDEAANALVTGVKHRKTGKKSAVNIDTLSAAYAAGDTVDAESLKEKGLIHKSAKQIKILARGTLDKPLTVIADDFSADAIKMIILTGGKALWS